MEYAFGEKHGTLALGLRERVTGSRQTTAGRCPSASAPSSAPSSSASCRSSSVRRRERARGFEPATRKGHLRHLVLRQASGPASSWSSWSRPISRDRPRGAGRPAGRGRARAPELRSRREQPRLGPGRVRADVPRRRHPFHRGEAGRPLVPDLSPSFFQTNTPGPSSSTAASARRPRSRRRAGVLGLYCAAGRSSSRWRPRLAR